MNRLSPSEQCLLILAPLGRDAWLCGELLREAGLESNVCKGLDDICAGMTDGAAGAVIAEESLATSSLDKIAALIECQPTWSDFPFIILTRHEPDRERDRLMQRLTEVLGNVTFVERPFHAATLISSVQSAMRGRLRQYEARRLLEERSAREAELRSSEQRYRTLIDALPQLVWTSRPDGRFDYLSRQWVDYTGIAMSEQLGLDWLERVVHPDDCARTLEHWMGAVNGRHDYDVDFRLRRYDGVFRWFKARGAPTRDERGRTAYWLGTCTDVQDNVEAREILRRGRDELGRLVGERTAALEKAMADREAAEARLRQSQKMEALGQLTGGIAHDFNNLLAPIMMSAELIRKRTDDEMIVRLVNSALEAVERGAKLTSQLLAFSRTQRLELLPVDVPALVLGMTELLERSLGPTISLDVRSEATSRVVRANANQLELALLNLAINARDAMPNGGNLTVVVSDLSTQEMSGGGSRRPQLCIAVSDTGLGMPPEVRERAFEPFYTTKGVGKGTGLGLSQVYGIAKQSSGTVTIDSAPGRGTTVRVLLPIADESTDAIEPTLIGAPALAPPAAARSETVLVTDDDAGVRRSLASMLAALGYRVREAVDGRTCLSMMDAGPPPDALILDFAMPGMNGAEVATAVRRRHPNLPIIIATGYADSTALETDLPSLPVLRKPFRMNDLANMLARALAPTDIAADD